MDKGQYVSRKEQRYCSFCYVLRGVAQREMEGIIESKAATRDRKTEGQSEVQCKSNNAVNLKMKLGEVGCKDRMSDASTENEGRIQTGFMEREKGALHCWGDEGDELGLVRSG